MKVPLGLSVLSITNKKVTNENYEIETSTHHSAGHVRHLHWRGQTHRHPHQRNREDFRLELCHLLHGITVVDFVCGPVLLPEDFGKRRSQATEKTVAKTLLLPASSVQLDGFRLLVLTSCDDTVERFWHLHQFGTHLSRLRGMGPNETLRV